MRKTCLFCQTEYSSELTHCPADGNTLTSVGEDDHVGKVFAERYEMLAIIGGGGMGLVYKARHQLMNRHVAIKVLHKHMVNSAEALKRFQIEAQAASSLKSPNILTIFDFGVSPEGEPYMVMDLLEGSSLSDLLAREGRLNYTRAIPIFTQVCSALQHAHDKGIIHRDMKPGNIMIVKYGDIADFVQIVDFGIAKLTPAGDQESGNLTRTGEVFGSPLYMSPEQCRGKKLDPRSDMYSVGCVMYLALTGKPVFESNDVLDLIFRQATELPPRFDQISSELEIPPELEAIIFKCLEKSPDGRYQSMSELKTALDSVLSQATISSQQLTATGTPLNAGLNSAANLAALRSGSTTVPLPPEPTLQLNSGPSAPGSPASSTGPIAIPTPAVNASAKQAAASATAANSAIRASSWRSNLPLMVGAVIFLSLAIGVGVFAWNQGRKVAETEFSPVLPKTGPAIDNNSAAPTAVAPVGNSHASNYGVPLPQQINHNGKDKHLKNHGRPDSTTTSTAHQGNENETQPPYSGATSPAGNVSSGVNTTSPPPSYEPVQQPAPAPAPAPAPHITHHPVETTSSSDSHATTKVKKVVGKFKNVFRHVINEFDN